VTIDTIFHCTLEYSRWKILCIVDCIFKR